MSSRHAREVEMERERALSAQTEAAQRYEADKKALIQGYEDKVCVGGGGGGGGSVCSGFIQSQCVLTLRGKLCNAYMPYMLSGWVNACVCTYVCLCLAALPL